MFETSVGAFIHVLEIPTKMGINSKITNVTLCFLA